MDSQPPKKILLIYITGIFLIAVVIVGLFSALSSNKKQAAQQRELSTQQQTLAASPYADPILKYLPYGDIGYNIDPSVKTINAQHTLVLIISVTFYDSDYGLSSSQQNALIQQREQAARDYLKSKGFDPTKYHIIYSLPTQ